MKKIINRKNAAAVACAAMMICAAGAVPDNVLSVSVLCRRLNLGADQVCLRSQG